MSDAQYKACGISMLTQKLALIMMLMMASTVSAGELKWRDSDEESESEVAYVDSVTKWGAWELDIEPAAGGLTPPSTGALNARDSRVTLRTNSISALAPPSQPPAVVQTPIMPPVVPSAPPAPPVTPPRPVAPTTFAPPGATPPTNVTFN
ncbi:MAG: hypothetical protein KJN89_03570 [Gammaproteobacteria bacterium]|nr:hypothetical protein [Gammaproteobacteria bacterium]NNJ49431.1 hypothetical protein [Gammaproteobacteria bacterium]